MKISSTTPTNVAVEELGRRLTVMRKAKRLSQTDLANQAGVGVATLKRMEAGKDAYLSSWFKVFMALGFASSLEDLLPETYSSPISELKARTSVKVFRAKPSKGNNIWEDS